MDLKTFCKENRVSQVELAELFGCGPGNVSNIVTGKRNLTQFQLRQLIDKFGFNVVSKYVESNEIPAHIVSIFAPSMHGDHNPVNESGTQKIEPSESGLIDVLKTQAAQITTLLQQQERLISLLESKNN